MATYSFVTEWRLDAPIDRVYDTIADAIGWPEWWKGVESVEEIRPPTDRTGVGRVLRYTFKGKLPYSLTFDMTVEEVDRPTTILGRARGELDGIGRWTLSQDGADTLVRYDWNIKTTRWWMNLFAPIASGAFKSNHDYIMRNGMTGICRRLGAVSGSCVWIAA